MTENEISGILRGHESRNEELLRTLSTKGVALDKGRSVEHHFWIRRDNARKQRRNDPLVIIVTSRMIGNWTRYIIRSALLSVLAGFLITPVLFVIGAILSGGGHSLTVITILFPYSGLVGFALKDISNWPAELLLIVQFPLYGLLLTLSYRSRRFVYYVIVLVVLHAAAASLCFVIIARSQFRPSSVKSYAITSHSIFSSGRSL